MGYDDSIPLTTAVLVFWFSSGFGLCCSGATISGSPADLWPVAAQRKSFAADLMIIFFSIGQFALNFSISNWLSAALPPISVSSNESLTGYIAKNVTQGPASIATAPNI